jgi:HEAT repeat protein
MNAPTINPAFAPLLESLGQDAGDFFLAAGLYQAHKVSFAAAAALAGLGYEEFHYRLKEHFGHGFEIADQTVLEDLRLVDALVGQHS